MATQNSPNAATFRLYALSGFLCLWLVAICLRLIYLQVFCYGDFEQRAGDVSLTHPRVTENYRAAHACDLRLKKGETVRTEELRTAMVHYRSLFDELVQAHTGELRQAAE